MCDLSDYLDQALKRERMCFNMCIIQYYALKSIKHVWTYSNVWKVLYKYGI